MNWRLISASLSGLSVIVQILGCHPGESRVHRYRPLEYGPRLSPG
jgi:hypothetical protein